MNEDNPRAGWSALLPDAWAWATFGDVAIDLTDSKRKLAKKSYQPAGRFPVIDQGEEFANGFSDEDGLVSKASLPCVVWGDHTRRSKFVKTPFIQGADGVKVLVPSKAVLPDFFFKQITFAELPDKGYSRHYKFLKAKEFPLPPLFEQRRIVRKLDTLSARTTTAYTHLSAIAKLVERYKLAVLGQLFGKSGMDPKPTEHLWAIPEHWSWKKVKEIGEVGLGRQRSPQNHSGPFMRPYLRSANITWLGVDTSDVKEMNFDAADFERFELKHGDVLLNEGSGSAKEVGKPAIWRGEITNCCYQNTVLRVQPRDCSSEYLYWYFLLTALSEGFVGDTKGVNIQHIGKNGLANFPIPVPPRSEQDEIVLNIQTAFTKIDLLAAEAEKALKLTDRLDQRILAKAFSGELIPQESTDEPASVLLNRIRAERASAPKPQRGRKKKADA
jgi:type I restriction enzyme, S subunit